MASNVYSVTRVNIEIAESEPPMLSIHVEGEASTSGWSGFRLEHYVYIQPPPDGIYEADLVGVPPGGIVLQVITPFGFDTTWPNFPREHFKGLRVHAATNSVTTMLS